MCEVCGKPVEMIGQQDIEDKIKDKIYRPGDYVGEELSEEEQSERRQEIAAMFASGKRDFGLNGDEA